MSQTERKNGHAGEYEIAKAGANIDTPSRQLEKYEYVDIIPPPLEPEKLLQIVQESDMLGQLCSAMATNVAKFGVGIRYLKDFDINKADAETKKQADVEWVQLTRLYKYMNMFEGIEEIFYKALYDKYAIGYGTIEVIRDTLDNIAGMEYCRSANIRLVKSGESATVKMWQETDNGYDTFDIDHKFKKFVQLVNGKRMYFKEFGDRRMMDCTTGEYSENVPAVKQATELLYLSVHNPASDYGLPMWVGALINALGSRLSEVLNYKYFTDGKIIPFAFVANNARFTKETMDAITQGKGVNKAYNWLVIEADSNQDTVGGKQNSSVDVKPIVDTNGQDGQFTNYQKQNRDKLRSTFRIAPIYTGDSSDYTRATADTARKITEEQVYKPEREGTAKAVNTIVNNERGIRYCEMYFKSPEISDPTEQARALYPYITGGAATPNMLIPLLEKLLNTTIEPLPDEIGNLPFELVKLVYQNSMNQKNQSTQIQKSEEAQADALFTVMEDIRGVLINGKTE